MHGTQIVWVSSLAGRITKTLSKAASESMVAKWLSRLGQRLMHVGKTSFLAKIFRADWGLNSMLSDSKFAKCITVIGARIEKTGSAIASKIHLIWSQSFVGQLPQKDAVKGPGRVVFGAGLILGLAAGTMAFGHLCGTLTARRQLAAAGLIPVGLLFLIKSGDIQSWIANSQLLRCACSFICQDATEDS